MNRPARSILIVSLLLGACGDPEPGTPVPLAELCRAEHEGQRVAVEGYLDVGISVFCSNIGGGPVTCGLELKASPADTAHVTVDVRQGGGGSEIEEVPEDFTRETLRIHAEDGTLVGLTDRVRVTGEANVVEAGASSVCFIEADLIERL